MITILDGAALAKQSEALLAERVAKAKDKARELNIEAPTRLATILVGDDPASATYVRMKGNACKRVGLEPLALELKAEETTTESLVAEVERLNADPSVAGILLQHPTPSHVDVLRGFDAITPHKDVDGVTCANFARLGVRDGRECFGAATPAGVMRLLKHHHIELPGCNAVVIGRSPILGKPMAMMLLNENATVTICHSRTRDLPGKVGEAELLVAAVGSPRFVRAEWVREGAVVVDAGYHPQHKCGDVEFEGLLERVAAYTPVPGGVGPMTINTLIANTVEALEAAVAAQRPQGAAQSQ